MSSIKTLADETIIRWKNSPASAVDRIFYELQEIKDGKYSQPTAQRLLKDINTDLDRYVTEEDWLAREKKVLINKITLAINVGRCLPPLFEEKAKELNRGLAQVESFKLMSELKVALYNKLLLEVTRCTYLDKLNDIRSELEGYELIGDGCVANLQEVLK